MCENNQNNKIVKKYYKNENNNDILIKEFTLSELNSSIIPTSKINKKYTKIKDINITSKEYIENLKENYNVDLKQEKWRKHPEFDIEVSNFGRVKLLNSQSYFDFVDEEMLKGLLKLKNAKKYGYVWVLVAETWLIKPQNYCINCIYDVHHLSNDGYDNRVENLIYLTKCQHSKINHKTKE